MRSSWQPRVQHVYEGILIDSTSRRGATSSVRVAYTIKRHSHWDHKERGLREDYNIGRSACRPLQMPLAASVVLSTGFFKCFIFAPEESSSNLTLLCIVVTSKPFNDITLSRLFTKRGTFSCMHQTQIVVRHTIETTNDWFPLHSLSNHNFYVRILPR